MKKNINKWLFVFLILITLFVLWHFFFYLFEGKNFYDYISLEKSVEMRGTLGDYFAGHFSVLAFIWLFYGIFIQSEEFKLQRKEFKQQTEIFQMQNISYRFENLFEKLDELLTQISYESQINSQIVGKYTGVFEIFENIDRDKILNSDTKNKKFLFDLVEIIKFNVYLKSELETLYKSHYHIEYSEKNMLEKLINDLKYEFKISHQKDMDYIYEIYSIFIIKYDIKNNMNCNYLLKNGLLTVEVKYFIETNLEKIDENKVKKKLFKLIDEEFKVKNNQD